MFTPRLTSDGIKTSKYYNRPFSNSSMPNCTSYAMFRICELLQRQCTNWDGNPSIVEDHCFNRLGFGNACDWYRDWIWEKGQTPRLGAVVCWSGTYKDGSPCWGHVAVVEQIYEDGSFLTSNSNYGGTFFYTQKIPADKTLKSNNYNFKFEGFCYIPLREVERDETKHQVRIKVDGLRIRANHSTNSEIIGICANNELFNVVDSYDDGTYRWLNIDGGWIATNTNWVDEYFPKDDWETKYNEIKKEYDEYVSKVEKVVNEYIDEYVSKVEKVIDEYIEALNKLMR